MSLNKWMITGFILAAISCNAGAIDKSQLRARYENLKQRYQALRLKGVDLRATDALVVAIENAKHQKNLGNIEVLLGDFEKLLAPLEQTAASSETLAPAKALPVKPAIAVASDQIRSEYDLVKALFDKAEFKQLLQLKANPRGIDAIGAAGRNIPAFSDVAAQRDAGWMLLLGLCEERPELVEKAILALEYAFARQDPQGFFQNGLGVAEQKAINADTFFLQAYAQVYGLLKSSRFAPQYLGRLDALQPKLRAAMTWLQENADEMSRQDKLTANRLAFDALAFLLNGSLLKDQSLIDIGKRFVTDALAMQTDAGVFLEKGGYDSSYQAVSLLNLQIAWLVLDDPQLRQGTFLAMVRGMEWLKSRILPSGEVSAIGNSRTGQGQETFFGKTKEVNYGEVAFVLFAWSVIANDKDAESLAKNVIGFALQHSPT